MPIVSVVKLTEHDGPLDVRGMQSLAEKVFPRYGHRTPGDLAWNLAHYYDRPEACPTALWRDNGDVVGWAWAERPSEAMLQIDPRYPGLAEDALDWARQTAPDPGLTFWTADTEIVVLNAFARAGFSTRSGPFFACLGRSLDNLPAVPELPDGYRIRELRPGDDADIEARAAVHRSAFDRSIFTAARYANLMTLWSYDSAFDLVAEAPDGTFAAFCLGWYDARNRVGEFEPVGTHPDHRRKGLASAVCIAAMHAFQARGGERAIVYSRGDEAYPVPKLVYEALGFRAYTRVRPYRIG